MADNIYVKLARMRVDLQRMSIKKSGKNTYSGYDYYELADILPPINELQEKYKTCSFVSFAPDVATLTIVNAEHPEEMIQFTSPMAELSLKAANPIQNLGGVETYQRRYLYMAAFEIVENDYFDATQGKPQGQGAQSKQKAPAKKEVKLSEATANDLNRAIKEYAAISKVSVQEVSKEITAHIGKGLQNVTETDAAGILELLKNWTQFKQEVG